MLIVNGEVYRPDKNYDIHSKCEDLCQDIKWILEVGSRISSILYDKIIGFSLQAREFYFMMWVTHTSPIFEIKDGSSPIVRIDVVAHENKDCHGKIIKPGKYEIEIGWVTNVLFNDTKAFNFVRADGSTWLKSSFKFLKPYKHLRQLNNPPQTILL